MALQLGGPTGRALLSILATRFSPGPIDWEAVDPESTSMLRKYFGDDELARMRGKRVIDFGCGRGSDVVAAALAGASEAIGVEVQDDLIESARAMAQRYGVADRCRFVNAITQPEQYAALDGGFDVVFTMDAFEHFRDPVAMLGEMYRLLAPNGRLVISFGPPWKHPLGAHLTAWIKLPWIHFLFDEKSVLDVRSHYLSDGAKRYEDVTGGLNKMTIARFRRIIEDSPFEFELFEPVPIRPLRVFAKLPLSREYVTSIVKAVCVPTVRARTSG